MTVLATLTTPILTHLQCARPFQELPTCHLGVSSQKQCGAGAFFILTLHRRTPRLREAAHFERAASERERDVIQ